jgi:Uma2 family endonuclease
MRTASRFPRDACYPSTAVTRGLHFEERLLVPEAAFDQGGFRAWVLSPAFPDGVRASWIMGEVFIEMSPESIDSHNKVKAAMTARFARIVEEEDVGELYADGVLSSNAVAGVSTEPDLAFASWATLETGRLRLNARASRDDEWVEIEGAPDIVVEIVSDSSVRKDLVRLREAYRRAGIPEYWVVDARGPELTFEILRLEGDAYVAAAPARAPQTSVVLGRAFTLSRARNRVGRWAYRLAGT